MKLIDVLNKLADGTLKDGFEFKFESEVYTYREKYNKIVDKNGYNIGYDNSLEFYLNDEVEVIEDVKEIKSLSESGYRDLAGKINELVQAVNELNKKNEKSKNDETT